MKEVIQSDTHPSILDTIGSTAMAYEMAKSAMDVGYQLMEMASAVRGESCKNDDVTVQFNRAFNKLLLCADYLDIEPDEAIQRIVLHRWHLQLQRAGREDAKDKFLSATYMEGVDDEC